MKKHEKVNVARMVVDTIKSMEPPGRFLKESEDSKSWVEIPIERVLKKTKQALREPDDDEEGSAITTGVTLQSPAYYPNSFSPHQPTDQHHPLPMAASSPTRSPNHDPSIIVATQKVDDGPLSRSMQAPFASNAHYQVTVNEVIPDTTMDLRNSDENFDRNNMQAVFAKSNATLLTELATSMGDSSSSIDTASTAPIRNSRRQYFRAMKNEATSLDSLISESNHSLDEDDIMKESLASIDIHSKSIEIQSIDMQSFGDSIGAAEILNLVGV